MHNIPAPHPDYGRLYEVAAGQQGLFTAPQATAAGYSPQLLRHHVVSGKVERVRRGIYRLVHFPAGDHEDLVAIWLWSGQSGVFSHLTALSLHQLSDALPHQIHLTVPVSWSRRRLAVPSGVQLHCATVKDVERSWVGPVPVTTVERTLVDCAGTHVSPELIRQAVQQAQRRGLLAPNELATLSHLASP